MRLAQSGEKGLDKCHVRGCRPKKATDCSCEWRGRYRGKRVILSKWAGKTVDPRKKGEAVAVLTRMRKAIDEKTFLREGEQPAVAADDTFAGLVREWKTHYAEPQQLAQNSLDEMLEVLTTAFGTWSLAQLADGALDIEKKLNATAKNREWSDNTWNKYHELFGRVLRRGVKWGRLLKNPIDSIERRTPDTSLKGQRIEEDVEARLFEACALLPKPKADEMYRRLIAGFDGGLRRGEMQAVQLKHINFRPVAVEQDVEVGDGLFKKERREVLRIELPPDITKGGKTTGEVETVYASGRFMDMLIKRRFELGNTPEAYVFGTKAGKQVKDFKKQWHRLFTLAGLQWGRAQGLTWHTLRHEFTSRVCEEANDPIAAQAAARHKDLETTQRYLHVRPNQLAALAVKMANGK